MPEPTEETRRDWEVVQQDPDSTTARLWVASGWLYRTVIAGSATNPGSVRSVAMVFVPGVLADK